MFVGFGTIQSFRHHWGLKVYSLGWKETIIHAHYWWPVIFVPVVRLVSWQKHGEQTAASSRKGKGESQWPFDHGFLVTLRCFIILCLPKRVKMRTHGPLGGHLKCSTRSNAHLRPQYSGIKGVSRSRHYPRKPSPGMCSMAVHVICPRSWVPSPALSLERERTQIFAYAMTAKIAIKKNKSLLPTIWTRHWGKQSRHVPEIWRQTHDPLVETPEKHGRLLELVMLLFSPGKSVTQKCLLYAKIYLLFTYEPCSSCRPANEK